MRVFYKKSLLAAFMALATTAQVAAQEWTEIYSQTFDDRSTTGIVSGGIAGYGRYISETDDPSPCAWIAMGSGFKIDMPAFLSADDWKVELMYAPRGDVNFYLKAGGKDITSLPSSAFCTINANGTEEKDLVWYDIILVGDKSAGTVTMTVPAGTSDYQQGMTVGTGFFNIDELGFWIGGGLAFIDEVHCYVKDALGAYKSLRDAALQEAIDWLEANRDADVIPSAALNELEELLYDPFVTDVMSSQAEYEEATAVISDALAQAQSLMAPYAIFKLVKENVNKDGAITGQSDVYEANSAAVSALESALSSASADNATTAEAISARTATLYAAVATFLKSVTINAGKAFDLTSLIVNPTFAFGTAADPTGWALTKGGAGRYGNFNMGEQLVEGYRQVFTLQQVLPAMAAGTYKLTLQGFVNHEEAEVTDNVQLLFADQTVELKARSAEWAAAAIYAEAEEGHDRNLDSSEDVDGETRYYPAGMYGASLYFARQNPATSQPYYLNEVETTLAGDGNLTIAVGSEGTTDWVLVDNFRLYFYGTGTATAISSAPLNDNGEMMNDNVYDLQGRRVAAPAKGLYIIGGKKVVVK